VTSFSPAPASTPLPALTTRVVSDRLILRPPRPSDVAELRVLQRANTEHLRPWEPAPAPGEDPSSITVLSNRVARQRRDWKRDAAYALLITRRVAGEPIIGRINLGGILRGVFQNAYLGYWMDREHQSQGFMTEAVRGTLAFAFGAAQLHRVQAAIMPRNGPSQRVIHKVGFRPEGLAERYLKIAGQWEDHALFAITSEEWTEHALPHATNPAR
jgi:ribosomal-protein-alanine N-acetyltransferase